MPSVCLILFLSKINLQCNTSFTTSHSIWKRLWRERGGGGGNGREKEQKSKKVSQNTQHTNGFA